MSEVVIKLPEVVEAGSIEDEIQDYFEDLSGYLTLDCLQTRIVTDEGLYPILEAANDLKSEDGNMQLINVAEVIYPSLMNTNVGGQRLISLVEIYTDRTRDFIGGYIAELRKDYEKGGVETGHFIKLAQQAWREYGVLHGGVKDEEYNRREIEFALTACIRDIEKRWPTTVDHLGYIYKKVNEIKRLADIPLKVFQDLIENGRFIARCRLWKESEGYGFLQYGKERVFVPRKNIIEGDGLIEKELYRFTAHYEEKGWQGLEVDRLVVK